jgi:hypothetical protein
VWLSEDPIQEEGGINLYGYVGNSPLMAVDMLGLQECLPNLQFPNESASARGDFLALVSQLRLAGHTVTSVPANSGALANAIRNNDETFFFGHGYKHLSGNGFDGGLHIGLNDGKAKTSLFEDVAKQARHKFTPAACYHSPNKSTAASLGGFKQMMRDMRELLKSPVAKRISYSFGPAFPGSSPINSINPTP